MATDDWQFVVDLCESMAADLPLLVAQTVDRIRQEKPDYLVIDRAQHEIGVARQYRGLLDGLIAHRAPSREEIEHARALGRQRAREGLPLEAMLGAFHVGYREMWDALLSRADARGPEISAQLVRVVGTVWTWVQQASSAAADAYGEAVRAEESAQLSLTYRFLEALVTGVSGHGSVTQLAQALAFDPVAAFQAFCSPAELWSDEDLTELRRQLNRRRGTLRCANRGTVMIAVAQRVPADAVVHAMRARNPQPPIGIGLVRKGLSGAAASIVDARDVLPCAADGGGVVDFRAGWLLATVRPHSDRLAVLLQSCREPAVNHPELARTVQSFADNGLSLTATGRALHVHANTVRYRLDRWRDLTGWDVRTWNGLSASMIGLGLYEPSA
ncbi:CdaR family transcriptional regulator [Kutzneria buriramensis]|uniref:Sugar diacid utilization regulator n=1 Tax=Kutzneria buriramensis TaxID=1045776 RepID=A0A3E0HE94_9PSEU|nr:helix-turn-helix domain-containing protein [Kutzneria buriramensis]REH43589.1 sugar diacid utilization regulator [Kutzneria buriramensis]